ncbi:MAG: MFS transporter, partial [Methylobacteriaceae bacterium]|nr:MFS transporter [Methylobacteriaceae bacterium]
RDSFLLSLATMSAATVAMGCLPTYAQAGAAATVAFVALRCVQGFCLGGELPGAITYAVEVVPERRATLACGIVFGCVSSGVLLATGVSSLVHWLLPPDAVEAYGWRLGFLIGGLLGIVSWGLRRSMEESPAFLRMRQRRQLAGLDGRGPLAELFARHRGRILVGVGATCVVAAFNGLLFAHMPAYLARTLGYGGREIATALNVASAATAVALVVATWIADIVPRRAVYGLGCLVIAAGALPAYGALVGKDLPLPTLFLLIGLAAMFTHGTFAAILADLFPTEVRFSGVAFSMNISSVIFSGLGPLAATWLIATTGRPDAPAYLVIGSALIALASLVLGRRIGGEIGPERAPDARPAEGIAPA